MLTKAFVSFALIVLEGKAASQLKDGFPLKLTGKVLEHLSSRVPGGVIELHVIIISNSSRGLEAFFEPINNPWKATMLRFGCNLDRSTLQSSSPLWLSTAPTPALSH